MNPLLKVDLEVDATDTNTKAEGTRSVKRGETLKMVHGKQAGETRTADVQLSIDSPVNIPLPTDFPQWKGPGKVEESNGQLTAQYNGNQSGNITVNPFSANAAMQAVNVVLVPENEVKFELDTSKFTKLLNSVESTVNSFYDDSDAVSFELNGSINFEKRNVDFADDGSKSGLYVKTTGSISAEMSIGGDLKIPIPTTAGLGKVELKIAVDGFKGSIEGALEYDESKINPAVDILASGSYQATLRASAGVVAGVEVCNLGATLEGQSGFSITNDLYYDASDTAIKTKGEVKVSGLSITGKVEFKVGPFQCRKELLNKDFATRKSPINEFTVYDF